MVDERKRDGTNRRRRGGRFAQALVLTLFFFAGGTMSAFGGDALLGEPTPGGAAPCQALVEGVGDAADAGACENDDPAASTIATDAMTETIPSTTAGASGPTTSTPEPTTPPESAPDHSPASHEPSAPAAPEEMGENGAVGEGPPAGQGAGSALDPPPSAAQVPVDPEVHSAAVVTLWLRRPFIDTEPLATRLAPRFARRLVAVARHHDVGWALVLGTLRAQGCRGRVPASNARVSELAQGLAEHGARRRPWAAVVALFGRTTIADRAVAFARYNRAVGLSGLVNGLVAIRASLARRVLSDARIEIYDDGRADVAAGRVDVKVLVLLRYLRLAHRHVTVSSLVSGHRVFARPGVISSHVFGEAVDITALGGLPVAGNQGPGSLTERAIRDILLLPAELLPEQVISLLGLGGPSFPLADHDDHIHVGF